MKIHIRVGLWVAAALVIAGGCVFNPQPEPPAADDDETLPGGGTGGTAGQGAAGFGGGSYGGGTGGMGGAEGVGGDENSQLHGGLAADRPFVRQGGDGGAGGGLGGQGGAIGGAGGAQ